jgi:hypothetical protein
MALNVKLQLYRGLLANLPATTGAPGVLAWTTDSNELFIDTGTAFQRIAPDNRVFNVTNVNQLAGLPAQLGDIAVLLGGSPAVPTATYVLTSYSSPFVQGDWTLISTSTTGTGIQPLGSPTLHEFVTYIDSNGVQHLAQPSFADISGNLSQTQLPATIGAGSSLTAIDAGTF